MAFVERVTKPGGPDFVPPAERIAVFDNHTDAERAWAYDRDPPSRP